VPNVRDARHGRPAARSTGGRRGRVASAGLIGALTLVCLSLSGCDLLSGQPSPTPASTVSAPPPTASPTPTDTPTPEPTPQLVATVTLVASLGSPAAATPGGLTWKGVQDAAAAIGAKAALTEPASVAAIPTMLEAAAGGDRAVVVTTGSDASAAVLASAAAHPDTQYLELGVAVAGDAPPNVHGLVFDHAEAGYLAGFVAASFTGSGKVALVGVADTDVQTTNYYSGFRNGAEQVTGNAAAGIGYAGTPDAPEKGRNAAAALVKAGDDVIAALPNLSGIGAMREACARGARLVAFETDASLTVPDVQQCLIVSVLDRYDVAARDALLALAGDQALGPLIVEDVASGGISLSGFHASLPEGFEANLDGVLAAMQNPPRPTPAPSAQSDAGGGSPSANP
jgi:basic membrane protein A